MVTRGVVLACALVVAGAGCMSRSAAPPPGGHAAPAATAPSAPSAPDAIEHSLYPVELVLERQAALGLDEAQTTAIRSELQRAQTELVDMQWRLGTEKEALAKALAVPRPDEAAALAAAERLVRVEGEIKLAHLRLLVRVKSQLTPAQQATLDGQR